MRVSLENVWKCLKSFQVSTTTQISLWSSSSSSSKLRQNTNTLPSVSSEENEPFKTRCKKINNKIPFN